MEPIKLGLGNLTSNISSVSSNVPDSGPVIKAGRVFGVITTNNTPTPFQFNKYGGFSAVGTVLYQDFDYSKDTVGSLTDDFLNGCEPAKPFFPQFNYFPLIGEVVYILELPSPVPGSPQKYYINPISLWGNSQSNAQTPLKSTPLGKTFVEDYTLRSLLNFEGDHIIQGRKGNSIRFGSTVKTFSFLNDWSDRGKNGDPITIISNGYKPDVKLDYYVENINNDDASIYLTSTQRVPLKVDKTDNLNLRTIPTPVNEYNDGSQVIINADRVVLNSKKENLMFFAKQNIEINTKNVINLNADNRIHLNARLQKNTAGEIIPKIFLGSKSDGSLPNEPLVLGNKMQALLTDLLTYLAEYSATMTACSSTQDGAPLSKVEAASENLYNGLYSLYDRFDEILSKQNFTV